jgi:S1-C subfamily serine protease
MFIRAAGVLAVLFLVLVNSTASARGPYGSIAVAGWSGGAFTDDNTGEFSNCIASASYKSGINFGVLVSKTYNWVLAFTHPSWSLTKGQKFPIVLSFDGRNTFNVDGIATATSTVLVPMPDNSALIKSFRAAHLMSAFAQGNLFQFDLKGTAVLLPSLVSCVRTINAGGLTAATNFTVVLPPKQPPVQAAAMATSNPEPNHPQATSGKTYGKSGTGFAISTSGHVVTNQHVIDGCVGDITANLSGEPQVVLRVVSTDETNDLALLQASAPFKDVANIREKPVHPGDSVTAIGFPLHGLLTSDFTVTTGIVSSLSGVLNDTRYLQISAAVQPGNSGGPLLDSTGEVMGVVAAKLNALKFAKATGDLPENVNFAIKTGALRDFLDNSAVAYRTADGAAELKTPEAASNARKFTLLISCNAKEAAQDKE